MGCLTLGIVFHVGWINSVHMQVHCRIIVCTHASALWLPPFSAKMSLILGSYILRYILFYVKSYNIYDAVVVFLETSRDQR